MQLLGGRRGLKKEGKVKATAVTATAATPTHPLLELHIAQISTQLCAPSLSLSPFRILEVGRKLDELPSDC